MRARLNTGLKFLGFFFASLCLAEGHRDPRNHFWRGGGAYCLLRSLFHTHVFCSRPRLFFFLCFFSNEGPRGPAGWLDAPHSPTSLYILDRVSGRGENAVFFPDFAFSRRLSGNGVGRAIRDSIFGSEVGGNAVRFCHSCFFHDLFDPLCLSFAVLLFLGSLFGIHFRGRTFVFPVFL